MSCCLQWPGRFYSLLGDHCRWRLQGLKGWTDSLRFYVDLTSKAANYPLKASQIFSSDVVGDGAVTNRLLNDAEAYKGEQEQRLADNGPGIALSKQMPTSGSNGGEVYSR